MKWMEWHKNRQSTFRAKKFPSHKIPFDTSGRPNLIRTHMSRRLNGNAKIVQKHGINYNKVFSSFVWACKSAECKSKRKLEQENSIQCSYVSQVIMCHDNENCRCHLILTVHNFDTLPGDRGNQWLFQLKSAVL